MPLSYQYYKNRVLRKGKTNQERIAYEKKRSFEEYLHNAPNAYTVKIDNAEQLAVIQDVKFNDENYQEKYLLVPIDTEINVGSYVEWDEKHWIVVAKENETIKSHQSCKIRPCNNILTFQDKNNLNTIHQLPCILTNKSSPYATGEDENKYFVLMDDKISITVPDNVITRQIELKKRFIFDHDKLNVYEVTKIDTLTRKGLINFTMEQSQYDSSRDRLDLNIADYIEPINPSEPPQEEGYTIVIEGKDRMAFMSQETFVAKIYNNGVEVTDKSVIWEIDKRFKVIETTDTTCTIEVPVGDYSTGKFPIKAILNDDENVYAVKEIIVVVF